MGAFSVGTFGSHALKGEQMGQSTGLCKALLTARRSELPISSWDPRLMKPAFLLRY